MRFQAQDKGAAMFDRQEGMWVGGGKIYFDCTEGGAPNLGQVWEYDPGRETLTLIYESTTPNLLKHPDNTVIVPQTGDMFLCEDSSILPQNIRGLTLDGEIYDFAQALIGESEFASTCFDPDGQPLYVNPVRVTVGNRYVARPAIRPARTRGRHVRHLRTVQEAAPADRRRNF